MCKDFFLNGCDHKKNFFSKRYMYMTAGRRGHLRKTLKKMPTDTLWFTSYRYCNQNSTPDADCMQV